MFKTLRQKRAAIEVWSKLSGMVREYLIDQPYFKNFSVCNVYTAIKIAIDVFKQSNRKGAPSLSSIISYYRTQLSS